MLAKLLEQIYDVLTHPVFALYKIAKQLSLQEAALLLVLNALIIALGQSQFHFAFLLSFVGTLAFSLLQIVIGAGIVHVFATFCGGHGDVRGLICATPYTQFPANLLLFGNAFTWLHLPALTGVWAFALSIWSLVLYVIAVAQNYGLSTSRAILVVILPFLCIAVLMFGIIATSLITLQQFIQSNAWQQLGTVPGVTF